MGEWPLLSVLIWLPILSAGLVVSVRSCVNMARWLALGASLVSVFLCWPLYQHMNLNDAMMQWQEIHTWLPAFNAQYALGIDGISLWLIILSAFSTLIVVVSSWTMVEEKAAQYLACFLVIQGCLVGVFSALDAILFYLFWEIILIPMYLIIGMWGGKNRIYASMKFFLYTLLGSVLLLVAIIFLGLKSGSFRIASFYPLALTQTQQLMIFSGFFAAFAVKVPMWPVHTWLPDAHTEAPTGGSVLLAAVLLKLGAYGFLRFSLPILPGASAVWAWPMVVLSLIGVVYIGLVAMAQTDMKRLIAYSSIAHMGFVTLGCFVIFLLAANHASLSVMQMGLEGAMIQVISHGFSSGALFLGFGMLYQRMHTRNLSDFGGVAKVMPIFSALYLIFVMANVALPGTSGFVGEWMVILSTVKANFWITILSAMTLILGAAYTLWMYKRVFYGPIAEGSAVAKLQDIAGIEKILLGALAVAVIGIGLYPDIILRGLHAPVKHLLQFALATK